MNSSRHIYLRAVFSANFGALLALACALPLHHVMAQSMPASAELHYQSAFQHYQAFADVKLLSWHASNEQVEKVGGWMAYAKQAHQPDPAPSSADAKTDTAAGNAKTEAASNTAPANKESKHQHHRSQP